MVSIIIKEWTTKIELVPAVQKRNAAVLLRKPGRLASQYAIVAKRENITHYNHANAGDLSGAHGFHSTSSTSYYVTFQVESGDRMELQVSGREYGMLAEGDIGKLTFQGTRYLSFERA